MRRVHDDSLVGWLRSRTKGGNLTGMDVAGWPASTWILHTIHERPDLRSDLTDDDVNRLRLLRRDQPETVIDDVDLDALLALRDMERRWHDPWGSEWARVRWRELAERSGVELGHAHLAPGQAWLADTALPANVVGPEEGSLDVESMESLMRYLTDHEHLGTDPTCFALYAQLPASEFDEPVLFTGPLSAIPSLVDAGEGPYAIPNNFWPEDRSWFVYTDYDNWATKVSGSESLIGLLRSAPDLETVDWEPRPRRPRRWR
jgi:hypothetical protein